ncbi:conserved hypothetical protein [Theileria equi strain WA]|uniref:Uncharacterized protein n=1 Tax=Theileria equi strain WA TaxID=1537102 RepID=L1LGE1_THEEQ|nr:conserved hypothetical protein [Theileria equi strain WA]EKX74213.1 conserved hypothetical protein [Theileria equi strain WA]|eukprot:XP_004833665.1 conserved hypothetical protein [Theileria equi strain WA]
MSKDLQKGAMFMAGLTLLQSLRVALTGAKFALDRFKIPQQYASSFINMVHNPMELATFTGMAIVTSISWTSWFKSCSGYFATFTNATLCLSFILLLYAFASGGQMGDLTFYYWTIVFGSFIYGLNVATVMTVASADAALFNVGIPLSGIQVSVYYYIFTKLARWRNWSNVSYWIIFWQLVIAILISFASAVLWVIIAIQGPSGGSTGKEGKNTGVAWSPILMGVVGMGGIYAFYPAIAPYKLTDVGTGYTIDLVVLFMSAVPGIFIVILCLCNGGNGPGPDQPWENLYGWWHAAWLFAIPHITAMVLCFVTLHYPDSGVASSIKSSGLKVGAITVTLKFCEEGLKAVSYAGAGKQVGKYCSCPCKSQCTRDSDCKCPCKETNTNCKTSCKCCKTCHGRADCRPSECNEGNPCKCKCCKDNGGAISSVNAFLSQGLMIILAFTGDGYLKTYSKYEHDRAKWPTKNFGTFRSILYWTGSGMWVACKSVKSSFTKNVRCKVLGKSEALLIVYADQEF